MKSHLPGAYIEEKVSVALGNVYLVQAQQTGDADLFSQAIDLFGEVTTAYEETRNDRIKGLAAIAYFGLGAAHERLMEPSDALSAYERCLQTAEGAELRIRCKLQRDQLSDSPR